jgi:hypothetical protein
MAIPEIANVSQIKAEVKPSSSLGISLPTVLPAPILLLPHNGYLFWNSTSIDFEWEAVAEADSYEMQLSLESGFENKDTKSVETELTEISIGMFEFSEEVEEIHYPLKEHTYNWRVRAIKDNLSSPWSEVWGFTLKFTPPPDRPMPPYIDELVAENTEVKPFGEGADQSLTKTPITVNMSDIAGEVDSYNWQCFSRYRDIGSFGESENWGSCLSEKSATGCVFTAPAISAMQENIDYFVNTGKGKNFTVTFRTRNTGGSSSGKCDITVRLQAGDVVTVQPTTPGAIWYESE